MQMERLLTPRLLTLEDLATFAVAATLIGSPFRMLQMGAGYTLLPRLSTAATAEERRQLVRREAAAIMIIGAAGALVILFAAPWVARWLLAGKYQLSTALSSRHWSARRSSWLTGSQPPWSGRLRAPASSQRSTG